MSTMNNENIGRLSRLIPDIFKLVKEYNELAEKEGQLIMEVQFKLPDNFKVTVCSDG